MSLDVTNHESFWLVVRKYGWLVFCLCMAVLPNAGRSQVANSIPVTDTAPSEPVLGNIYIREYRLRGAKVLTRREFEKAVQSTIFTR